MFTLQQCYEQKVIRLDGGTHIKRLHQHVKELGIRVVWQDDNKVEKQMIEGPLKVSLTLFVFTHFRLSLPGTLAMGSP